MQGLCEGMLPESWQKKGQKGWFKNKAWVVVTWGCIFLRIVTSQS